MTHRSRATAGATERGVTLIELLIAITLVAALAVGMLMAIRSSLTAMERINVRLEENRRVMGIQQIVSRQIGGVIPLTGCRLSGTSEGLRLVTTYSVNEGARGFPHYVEFFVEPDPAGGVRLAEAEYPYAGSRVCGGGGGDSAAPPLKLVLAGRLFSCTFSYHQTPPPNSTAPGNWVQTWNAPLLPSAVRIVTQPLDGLRSNLPALAVNAPIHITKLQMQYVDQE